MKTLDMQLNAKKQREALERQEKHVMLAKEMQQVNNAFLDAKRVI